MLTARIGTFTSLTEGSTTGYRDKVCVDAYYNSIPMHMSNGDEILTSYEISAIKKSVITHQGEKTHLL